MNQIETNFELMELKFVCDVHIGKLAKALRMLGFDTVYQNTSSREDLEKIAVEESRILLSRNAAFSKNAHLQSFILTHQESSVQLRKVLEHFDVKEKIHPFTLCLECNAALQRVLKEHILTKIPPNTANHFNEFWQCCNCKRIYWKGLHYERMLKEINGFLS